MPERVDPSRWAVEQFGEHAAEVQRHVVTGLVRGQRSARLVQEAAEREGAGDRRPYGSMWAFRYKGVVEQFELADLTGYEAIKPRGASYSLAVINRRVIIPFRHSTTLVNPISNARLSTAIPRRVSREHGVNPMPTLFDTPEAEVAGNPSLEEAAAAAQVDERFIVVYVGYVANADSDDVLAAWWGTPTSLEADGRMIWAPERLNMSIADSSVSGRGEALRSTETGSLSAGFTQGPLPDLPMRSHSEVVDRPVSEVEERNSEVQDGDE